VLVTLLAQPQSTPDAGDVAAEATAPADTANVIQLAFAMPDQFSIARVEQDDGQTIYFLNDTLRDDVVLTLEHGDAPNLRADMMEVDLGQTTAHALHTPDYSVLTFEKDGTVYTMTCRHDLNTLVSLGRHIV